MVRPRDSNPRPPAPKADALPTELSRRCFIYWQLLIILFADDRVKKIWNYTSKCLGKGKIYFLHCRFWRGSVARSWLSYPTALDCILVPVTGTFSRFRVISAHVNFGPCQFRPIAISAHKFCQPGFL